MYSGKNKILCLNFKKIYQRVFIADTGIAGATIYIVIAVVAALAVVLGVIMYMKSRSQGYTGGSANNEEPQA